MEEEEEEVETKIRLLHCLQGPVVVCSWCCMQQWCAHSFKPQKAQQWVGFWCGSYQAARFTYLLTVAYSICLYIRFWFLLSYTFSAFSFRCCLLRSAGSSNPNAFTLKWFNFDFAIDVARTIRCMQARMRAYHALHTQKLLIYPFYRWQVKCS